MWLSVTNNEFMTNTTKTNKDQRWNNLFVNPAGLSFFSIFRKVCCFCSSVCEAQFCSVSLKDRYLSLNLKFPVSWIARLISVIWRQTCSFNLSTRRSVFIGAQFVSTFSQWLILSKLLFVQRLHTGEMTWFFILFTTYLLFLFITGQNVWMALQQVLFQIVTSSACLLDLATSSVQKIFEMISFLSFTDFGIFGH